MAHGDAAKVGLVLAGGGARGAYEAGVLSVLLPVLEERGQPVRVIVGTSVGAISAAFLAANAHRGADALADAALERWGTLRRDHVMGSLAGRLPRTALGYLGQAFGVPGARVESLLDTTPLAATLDDWINWDQLHANVINGAIASVAVVATRARDGRSVVFADSAAPLPADGDKLGSVTTRLANEHVRASAAIPILFPPIRVDAPAPGRGWYYDGGTRLNTPIKPAIDQGAERVVVIALDSIEPSPSPADDTEPRASPTRAPTCSRARWSIRSSRTSGPWRGSTRSSERMVRPGRRKVTARSRTSSSPRRTGTRSARSPIAYIANGSAV